MSSDEALLGAWQNGDRSAGSRLLERYFQPLYRFFRNKVDHGVDDLIQQTLEACVQGKDRVQDAPNFRAYVFGVARNLLFAHFRSQERHAKNVDPEVSSVVDLGSSPSRIVARRAEEKLLGLALRAIPVDHQIALELFYWEDLTGPELAAVLGVPEGTVRTRLRRARQLLLERMEALAGSELDLDTTRANLDNWARSLRNALSPGQAGDAVGPGGA